MSECWRCCETRPGRPRGQVAWSCCVGPFGDPPRAFLFGKVLDPGHHRPPHAERVPDTGEPVAGHERGWCLTDDGTGRLSPGGDGVDVWAVEADGVAVLVPSGRRDEAVVGHRL